MSNLRLTILGGLLAVSVAGLAQEAAESSLSITGSVDTYYKYDFSGTGNIYTSFADEQNSISIGMLDLILEKTSGKSYFKAEVSFGPRSASSVGPGPFLTTVRDGETETALVKYLPNIQNLYVSYNLTEKLKVTAGYMATFVGYELISPTGNYNYSTSYLFTNGPFQNAGVKLEYALSDKVGLMAGAFNNAWNVYTADPELGPSLIGGQLRLTPKEGFNIYLNALSGGASGTIGDLTAAWQVTEDLLLGLNGAYFTDGADTAAVFNGVAGYAKYGLTDAFSIGARFEHFYSSGAKGILGSEDASVNSITLSANIAAGAITFIPEVRTDLASTSLFSAGDGSASKQATQALIAAVYKF